MEGKLKEEILDVTPKVNNTKSIAEQLIDETDADNIKALIDQFNLFQTKRNALRVITYENLLDKVSSEMGNRLTKYSDTFTNEELIKYLNILQDAMDKSTKALNGIKDVSTTPVIVNQIQVQSENQPIFNSESRKKIDDAVKAMLALIKADEDVGEKTKTVIDVSNEDMKPFEFANEDTEIN